MTAKTVTKAKGKAKDMENGPMLQISTLECMGPDLWYIWMIVAFNALEKYASHEEYDEFLKRITRALVHRTEIGVW